MAMCEYAWTSFNQNAKRFEIIPQDSSRFHPTAKPLQLIEWCLRLFSIRRKYTVIHNKNSVSTHQKTISQSLSHTTTLHKNRKTTYGIKAHGLKSTAKA